MTSLQIAHNNLKKTMSKKDELVNTTFYITYAFLMTTATITFIEDIRTKDIKIFMHENQKRVNIKTKN